MGQFDAIKGMAALSVPVSEINPIYSGTDSKRQQALLNSSQLAQGIYESVDDYYKRRAEFLAEQNKKIQAENTAIAQKKYNNVANLDIWNTNNLSTLQNAQNQLASFFRFLVFFVHSIYKNKFSRHSSRQFIQLYSRYICCAHNVLPQIALHRLCLSRAVLIIRKPLFFQFCKFCGLPIQIVQDPPAGGL